MATELRFCWDCRHFEAYGNFCNRPLTDLVSGETYSAGYDAAAERRTTVMFHCGQEGLFWEAKETIDKAPILA